MAQITRTVTDDKGRSVILSGDHEPTDQDAEEAFSIKYPDWKGKGQVLGPPPPPPSPQQMFLDRGTQPQPLKAGDIPMGFSGELGGMGELTTPKLANQQAALAALAIPGAAAAMNPIGTAVGAGLGIVGTGIGGYGGHVVGQGLEYAGFPKGTKEVAGTVGGLAGGLVGGAGGAAGVSKMAGMVPGYKGYMLRNLAKFLTSAPEALEGTAAVKGATAAAPTVAAAEETTVASLAKDIASGKMRVQGVRTGKMSMDEATALAQKIMGRTKPPPPPPFSFLPPPPPNAPVPIPQGASPDTLTAEITKILKADPSQIVHIQNEIGKASGPYRELLRKALRAAIDSFGGGPPPAPP